MLLGFWTALAACAVAVVTDVRSRRVPNWVTLPLVPLALILALPKGLAALGFVAVVIVCMTFVGLVIHRLGWLGGGDVKLLIGVGALLGFPGCVSLVLCTGVAGGILAAGVVILRGRAGIVARQLQSAFTGAVISGGKVSPVALSPSGDRFPYAVAIAVGLVVTILSETYVPALRIPL